MPVKSKQQWDYIWMLRNKYQNKANTPEDYKWIWDDEWFKDIEYDKLKEETLKTFIPPESVAKEAQKALDYKYKYGDEVDAGTRVGWTRANQLAKREPISIDTIKRMVSFFARHQGNEKINSKYKNEVWKDNGYISWLLWGGNAGKSWAEKILKNYENKEEEKYMRIKETKVENNLVLQKLVIKENKIINDSIELEKGDIVYIPIKEKTNQFNEGVAKNGNLSDKEIIDLIKETIKLDLKKLRRNQDLVNIQMEMAYKQKNKEAMLDLAVMGELYRIGVDIKEFGDTKPEDYIDNVRSVIKQYK